MSRRSSSSNCEPSRVTHAAHPHDNDLPDFPRVSHEHPPSDRMLEKKHWRPLQEPDQTLDTDSNAVPGQFSKIDPPMGPNMISMQRSLSSPVCIHNSPRELRR